MLTNPGRTITEIPPDVYGPNQINTEPVKAVGSWVGIGSHVGVDADTVYAVTKAMFDNLADMKAAAEWLDYLTPQNALLQLNCPVHAGAYRWYKENGVEVPEQYIPPEAM